MRKARQRRRHDDDPRQARPSRGETPPRHYSLHRPTPVLVTSVSDVATEGQRLRAYPRNTPSRGLQPARCFQPRFPIWHLPERPGVHGIVLTAAIQQAPSLASRHRRCSWPFSNWIRRPGCTKSVLPGGSRRRSPASDDGTELSLSPWRPSPGRHGCRVRQTPYPCENAPKQVSRNRNLRHLKRHVPSTPHDLGPDLDELLT